MINCYLSLEPDPKPDQMLILTTVEVLGAYLDSITLISPNGSSDDLSAGAIAGIVVSVIVILTLVVLVISAVSIYFCKHSKYKK